MKKIALPAILSMALFAPELAAQSSREVVTQSTEWFSAGSTIKFHERAGIFIEGIGRFVQQFEPMQFQARTSLELEVNKHLLVNPLGYVYTWNPLYGKQPNKHVNNEHRIFQQVTFKHKLARAAISHRFRSEQRFIQVHAVEGGEVVNKGYDLYQNRLRYRLNANIPFNKPNIEAGTVFGVVYDEIFLSLGEQVTYHEPDQNRMFAGLGYSFTSQFSLQAGPFYQILIKAGGSKQENNVGFSVNLTYNIDLTQGE